MAGSQFKRLHFDAISTISQILILQSYSFTMLTISICISLSIMNLGQESILDLGFLLDSSLISSNTLLGWSLFFVYLTHSILTVPVAMLYVVQRSRLCLDFGCSVWGLHMVLGWYFLSLSSVSLSAIY